MRRLIVEERPTNPPKYYDKMSVLLAEVIRQRKAAALSYEEYLQRVVEIAQQSQNPETASKYPSNVNTKAKRLSMII